MEKLHFHGEAEEPGPLSLDPVLATQDFLDTCTVYRVDSAHHVAIE